MWIERININSIEAIIIDGYIYVDNEKSYGLGGKLYEKLGNKIPVIGVAKTPFFTNKETVKEINRGKSKNPLYISSIGIDLDKAAKQIEDMYGNFRIPEILKKLDAITKTD